MTNVEFAANVCGFDKINVHGAVLMNIFYIQYVMYLPINRVRVRIRVRVSVRFMVSPRFKLRVRLSLGLRLALV